MKIIEITKSGISYLDDLSMEKWIDFVECNVNWIKYQIRTEKLNEEQAMKLRGKDHTVGRRDICASPPYIQLFTKPFTKFEFDSEEAFSEVRNKIAELGWSTLDMS
ncbi:hypothetical protein [Paenibacillus sp. 32352]|uniref:hypothetical protein n=1 Tax=Paenibacillus sp. 32352 TaxID=1969111 RepID=UPI0009ACCDE8|nr:hypothetical protein [Paenibacillus sp. 32352]